jgi:hypothetical protein
MISGKIYADYARFATELGRIELFTVKDAMFVLKGHLGIVSSLEGASELSWDGFCWDSLYPL